MDGIALVTGAAGFIGSHLCERLLSQGWYVVGVDNFCDFYDPRLKRLNVANLSASRSFYLIEADIRDAERVEAVFTRFRPKIVFHIAAMAGVRPSIEAPLLYTEVNVDGTVNLLMATAKHGAEKFVFASSSSVYGNNPKVPFSEEDPVDHPISPYAATKKAGELLCYTFSHLYGFQAICLRLFTVFGPRQRPDLAIAKFMRLMALGRELPIFGDGSMSRDYTYIDDIIDGIMAAAMRCEHRYRIYNLGGSNPVSLMTLVDVLQKVTNIQAQVRFVPPQPGDVERTFADLSRSYRELGFWPKVDFEDGIRRQWEWFRATPERIGC